MPYKIRKLRNSDLYKVFNANTGKIFSHGSIKKDAKAQVRLLQQKELEGEGEDSDTDEDDSDSDTDSDLEGSDIDSDSEDYYKNLYNTALQGGKLSVSHLKGLLSASYSKKPKSYLEYEVDKELSGQRVQVYKNPKTGQVIVSHRGTKGIHDIGNDLKYALGFDLKNTKRFKHGQDIQRKAEEKYGAKNISTIGHSLGSKLARDVGKHSKEVIELNPAYNIPDIMKKKSDNTYSIRTKYDPVSFLVPLKKDKNITTIKSKSLNPLAEHTVEVLDRIDPNTEIGAGLKKKKLKELKQIAKSLPKKQRIKLTKIKKEELVKHLCSCGGYE